MQRLVEIRSYKLKPGSGARFHDLVVTQSMPLLRECGMEVVAFGNSLHDPDAYFLIRAYDSPDHRRSSQEAFYSSGAWRNGPRQSIVELIEADWDVVLWLTSAAVDAMRNSDVSPMELNQVTLPALDVAASVAFYRNMGFELIVDAPHYARFKSTMGNATFSVHAVGALPELSKTVVYFECNALDQQVRDLQARGFQFAQEPRDEPWLWREARLVDPSGNDICLYHAGENRLNPPWRVGA